MSLTASCISSGITDQVTSIPALSRGDLIERWRACHGNLPPKAISTRLLVFAAAYAMQTERYGGLSRQSQKELLRLSGPAGTSRTSQAAGDMPIATHRKTFARSRAAPRHGTRFVREWNGKSHVVEVVENRFAWQGKIYQSLSAIATSITGSRWSGPRFFGLK